MIKPIQDNGNREGQKVPGRGIFITFEGGEGAGKTSQIKLLTEKLSGMGCDVITTREPGGSPGGEAIRHVLLSGAAEAFGNEMEAILFSASRSDHVDTLIEPALKAGKIVISDRFFDSTRVYQGISGKVDMAFIKLLESIACGNTLPDITIIIDLDPEIGMERARKRRGDVSDPDRFEKDDLAEQKRRREGFLQIAKAEPERCVVVSGKGSEKQVHARIWRAVKPRIEALLAEMPAGKPPQAKKKTTAKVAPKSGQKPAARKRPAKEQKKPKAGGAK